MRLLVEATKANYRSGFRASEDNPPDHAYIGGRFAGHDTKDRSKEGF